jgi:hypothetical protein
MSHHFDTPTAKEDPRINVCDFYLFRGRLGTTVMALTVNPNAGVGAPDTFRDEGLYAFRFDTNRDLREEVAFKVQFGAPTHADGGEHRHVQTFAVRRATGADALKGAAGELIISGNTGRVVKADRDGANGNQNRKAGIHLHPGQCGRRLDDKYRVLTGLPPPQSSAVTIRC